ncbi:ribonuclease H-like domain-containing protein [Tanacetum coccineum]
MEAGTTSITLTARLPILNPGEYDLYLMRIEQYFLMTDYSLWEVIMNGNKVLKRQVGEIEQEYEPTTIEEKQDRRNEMKARGTLLMALLNKDQLKFHSYKDAKLLMEAIEKSQLEIQGEVIAQEDMNLKLLRSLPSEWKTHALIWRNKDSTNKADKTAYGVSAAHTQSNPVNSTSVDNLSDVVICAFLASRKLDINGQRISFDRSKVECYNCHKNGYFAREYRAPRNQENRGRENGRRTVTVETPTKNALIAQDGIGGQVSDKFKTGLGYNATSPAVEILPPYTGNFIPRKPDLTFMDEIVESENMDVTTVVTPSNVKKVVSNHKSAGVKNNGDAVEPKTVRENSFRPLVIEDWNSDDDSEVEFIPNVEDKTVRPSIEKIKFVKSARETVKKVIRPVWNNSSRVNHKNFANKMTHPHPNRRFVPQAVLTRSGKINTAGASVNTADARINTAVRPVNTAGSKPTVNHPRSISNTYKKGYSQYKG